MVDESPRRRTSRRTSAARPVIAVPSLADVVAERLDPSAFWFPGILRRPRVTAVRPQDLLVVAFEFRHLTLKVDESGETPAAFLHPDGGSKQSHIIVHFQPQNVAEQAFFETAAELDLKGKLGPTGAEVRKDRDASASVSKGPPSESALPVDTLIAGPSQVVFEVPAGAAPIPYTIEGIIDAIRGLELSVPATALPPDPPSPFPKPIWVDEITTVIAKGVTSKFSAAEVVRAKARLQRWQDTTDMLPVTIHGDASYLGRLDDARPSPAFPGSRAGGRTSPLGREVIDVLEPGQVRDILDYLRRHPRLAQPGETDTALELPFRLLISPNRSAAWAHSPLPVSSDVTGRTELWHTRLATRVMRDGEIVIEEGDHRLRTIRAVWARGGSKPPLPNQQFSTNPANRPSHSNAPFRMSLDAADRFDVVHESANFNLPKAGNKPRYRPVPVDVDALMLTSLGAWIDSRGQWEPPTTDFEVEEWRHRGTMARDHYVRVVYKGYLWPFGHRASVIKVTERKLHPPATPSLPGNPAILRQRMYIVVRQPVLPFSDPTLKNGSGHFYDHQFPFTQVRITSLVTPNLDPPEDVDYPKTFDATDAGVFGEGGGEQQSLFWPHVGSAPFPFHIVAEDLEGRRVEFTAPLLFVSNVHAFGETAAKEQTLNLIKQHYEDTVAATLGTVRLNGQRVALAPAGEPGDTMFEAEALELGVEIPSKTNHAKLGPDRPRFYPRIRRAKIVVPVVKQFTGKDQATVVSFADAFLKSGFPDAGSGHPNDGQVFLQIADAPLALDFSAGGDKAGAFVQPNLDLSGISRLMGPVGGDLASLAGGTFDPANFFDALKARLFGVVDLGELIKGAGVDARDLIPKFVTEAIAAVEAFTNELTRLEARLAALKAQADASASVPAAVKAQVTTLQADITAHVLAITAAIDDLLDGTDATADLVTAVTTLNGDLTTARTLIGTLGPAIPSDVRQTLEATLVALQTDVGDGAAAFAEFVGRLKEALQLPEELTMRFDWKPEVQDWPYPGDETKSIFLARNTKANALAVFTIAAELQAKTKLRPEPRMDVACRLHNFTLNLIGEQSFLLLHFNKLEFTARSGSKPDVNVEFDDIEFTGVLSFVEALRTLIPLDGFSDPPALQVSEKGISASYSMALPDIAVGVFSMQNLSLGAGFTVPFLLDPLSVRFNFCERESPFLLTVSMFGGGGFFAVTLDPDGVQILEASFEFGASLSVNLGVASGGVTIMAGIYYKMEIDEATLTGYFRMCGEVDVLGLISACIELYLGLAYEFESGKCAGKATITVEVSIAFFSTSVSISCERKFAGSNGDPSFAQLMGPGPDFAVDPWTKYCEAFA